jgi:hypothetical protein
VKRISKLPRSSFCEVPVPTVTLPMVGSTGCRRAHPNPIAVTLDPTVVVDGVRMRPG